MSPAIKYGLWRLGIFIVCLAAAVLLLPRDMNTLVKLMIALVVSAALSLFLLRSLREEVAEGMSRGASRRVAEKERLRNALAGDDEPPPPSPAEDPK
jgi:uncharacterized protein DUF4229